MLDLQCVRTTVIGLETVVLRRCLEMLIHYPSSIFYNCVQRTMKLRNYRKISLQLSDVTGIIKNLILFQMITCTTMLIHGHSDSAFGHYQQEMRCFHLIILIFYLLNNLPRIRFVKEDLIHGCIFPLWVL
uniref:Uncharacterized protein n=1 Tax=Triticum urartu TaxID=4572 RepID=A0A8R7PFQ8_TRIUA